MSVLLFMPEAGGNPLESVIMTTDNELEEDVFEFVNGKPVRKLSCDSNDEWNLETESQAPQELNTRSQSDEESTNSTNNGLPMHQASIELPQNGRHRSHSLSDLSGVQTSRTPTRKVPARTSSAKVSRTPHSPSSVMSRQSTTQLRLTPMGAILGATAPGGAHVVKAVNKVQERKVQREHDEMTKQQAAASSKVHLGVYA